jgi:signal peptidase I
MKKQSNMAVSQEPEKNSNEPVNKPAEDGDKIKIMPVDPPKGKDDAVELLKAMAVAAIIALLIRSFLFEPFNIPSGSMFPTLLVGDYLFVEKYSYGYSRYSFPGDFIPFEGRIMESQPKRGDVIVFRQPKHPEIDYIKRLIGLPGDKIQMKEGRLYINGKIVPRDFQGTENFKDEDAFNVYNKYIETLPNGVKHYIYEISDEGPLDNTDEYVVPDDMYFAMGDNRDASLDSRVQDQVGFVPAENLVGRAAFIFYSTEGLGGKCNNEGTFSAFANAGCAVVTYPQAIRFSRIFKIVNKL